jgi:histone deacetylase complex subunit SAP18
MASSSTTAGAPARVDRAASGAPAAKVDRAATCPLLIRAFVNEGRHHPLSEFVGERTPAAACELEIHGWSDTTLREIAAQVQERHEAARKRSARISISLVYPDRTGRYVMKSLGVLAAARESSDDARTIGGEKAQPGDYLDVAILSPP